MQKRSVQIYTITQSKVSLSLHPAILKPYEFLTKLAFSTPLMSWSSLMNDAIASSFTIPAIKISPKEFQVTGGLLAYRFYELQASNDCHIDILVDKKQERLSSVRLAESAWLEILILLRSQLHTNDNRTLYRELFLDDLLPEMHSKSLLAGDPEHPNRKMNINRISDLLGIDRNCFSRAQNTQSQHKQALTDLNSGKAE